VQRLTGPRDPGCEWALPALNPDFLYAALDATAYAAFVKESRKKRAGATKLHRKSGGARVQRRDSSQSAKALFPPHKCGGSHHQFG
jgi:hypothetical protein